MLVARHGAIASQGAGNAPDDLSVAIAAAFPAMGASVEAKLGATSTLSAAFPVMGATVGAELVLEAQVQIDGAFPPMGASIGAELVLEAEVSAEFPVMGASVTATLPGAFDTYENPDGGLYLRPDEISTYERPE
jgi:hypothetical protein